MTEQEYKKHHDNMNKKLNEEEKILVEKQKKRYEAMTHKFMTKYSEVQKERALKFDELIQKYKNKHKEQDQNQKGELSKLESHGKRTFLKSFDHEKLGLIRKF